MQPRLRNDDCVVHGARDMDLSQLDKGSFSTRRRGLRQWSRWSADVTRKCWSVATVWLGLAVLCVTVSGGQTQPADAMKPPILTKSSKTEPPKTASTATTPPQSTVQKEADGKSGNTADFVRFRVDANDKPIALETAVTHYVVASGPHKGVRVDLIGAIHIGEKSYYEKLNKRFATYDAVLYELVTAEKTRVPDPARAAKSKHPITILQTVMKDVLELEFQLDLIKYGKPNMVHADMSPQEFAQSMKDRGESFLQMFMRMMGKAMLTQSQSKNSPNEMQVLVALLSRNRALKLKQLMARQFQDVELQTEALSGPDGSTIITERNKKALEVLDREIKGGKRHLAIFYGAGHLRDMESRLIKEFSMQRTGQEWLVAWSLQ